MEYFEKSKLSLDVSNFEKDISYDELLELVQVKYSAYIKPKGKKVEIIVRIQCAIEIISNILDQIEFLIKETFKITFTLSTIRNAIYTINKDLISSFKEVKEFFNSMKNLEIYNNRTFNLLHLMSKEIKKFEKFKFLIPESEKTVIEENIEKEIPLIKRYLHSEIIGKDKNFDKELTGDTIFGTSVLQVLYLNDVFKFLNRLRQLHCEFSFILLHIFFKDLCPSKDRSIPSDGDVSDSYLEGLYSRFTELADLVFKRANTCRQNFVKSHKERKRLVNNYRKKQELQIKQLNNLQLILRIIKELNEKHDTLTGKLIKTTEFYSKVHAILEKPWPLLEIYATNNDEIELDSEKRLQHIMSSDYSKSLID